MADLTLGCTVPGARRLVTTSAAGRGEEKTVDRFVIRHGK